MTTDLAPTEGRQVVAVDDTFSPLGEPLPYAPEPTDEYAGALYDPIKADLAEAARMRASKVRGRLTAEMLDTLLPGPERWVNVVPHSTEDHAAALRQTVRVKADGAIKRGVKVKHEAANLRGANANARLVATPPRVIRSRRFAPGGIPAGVDQTITIPHDCNLHLDGGLYEQTPQPKVDVRPLA